MRVYNEDSQPRTAQDMPRARAKMRLADQVAASEGQKDALLRILMFVVLSDAIGTFIMTPVTPRIYTPPPDSAKAFDLDNGLGVFADEAADFPLGGFSAAFQYGQMANQLAIAISNFLSPFLCKAIGRRNVLLIFSFGGSAAYLLSALSGWLDWGMYTYWCMRALMGLFGGSQPIVTMYVAEMWADADPAVKQKKLMAPTSMVILAVLLGPLIGMAVVETGLLFLPLVIGGALSSLAGALVLARVPSAVPAPPVPVRALEDEGADDVEQGVKGDAAKARESAVPGGYLLWVALFWIARIADRTANGQFQYLQTAGVLEWGNIAIKLLPVIIVALGVLGVGVIPMAMKLSMRWGF